MDTTRKCCLGSTLKWYVWCAAVCNLFYVFHHFPDGAIGAGLLVLRVTLATMLVGFGLEHDGLALPTAVIIVPAFAIACLCIGFLTTWIAVFCGLGAMAAIYVVPDAHGAGCALASAISLSVALVGPGAFSVDHLRYGRRVRVFPPED